MSTIDRYTLEDSEGSDQGYFFEGYQEAKDRARTGKLKVICNEYAFDASYMVDDFTEDAGG